jgi:hypothetical protein
MVTADSPASSMIEANRTWKPSAGPAFAGTSYIDSRRDPRTIRLTTEPGRPVSTPEPATPADRMEQPQFLRRFLLQEPAGIGSDAIGWSRLSRTL